MSLQWRVSGETTWFGMEGPETPTKEQRSILGVLSPQSQEDALEREAKVRERAEEREQRHQQKASKHKELK